MDGRVVEIASVVEENLPQPHILWVEYEKDGKNETSRSRQPEGCGADRAASMIIATAMFLVVFLLFFHIELLRLYTLVGLLEERLTVMYVLQGA
jgi:hypothetical protein